MAIYALNPQEQICLDFVLERIYLRRDGNTSITVDLLIQNTGSASISRLRVALPYSLVDIQRTAVKKVDDATKRFRHIEKLKLAASELILNSLPDLKTRRIGFTARSPM